jgi:YggT family protein
VRLIAQPRGGVNPRGLQAARPPASATHNDGRIHIMNALFWLLGEVIHLMILAIIISAVLSTLISFGIVDGRNNIVYQIDYFFRRVTDPVLNPIRRMLPMFGGVDLSPLVAILLLQALTILLSDIYAHLLLSGAAF